MKLLTAHSEPYRELHELTLPSKQEYCERWGIELEVRTFPGEGPGPWARPKMWREVLEAAKELIWMGADVMVTNMALSPLEVFGPCVDFQIGYDMSYHLPGNRRGCSDDAFYINRSAQRILDCIIDADSMCDNEQTALNIILPLADSIFRIGLVPLRQIASYVEHNWGTPEEIERDAWQTGDFASHFSGIPLERRIELAREYQKRIVR